MKASANEFRRGPIRYAPDPRIVEPSPIRYRPAPYRPVSRRPILGGRPNYYGGSTIDHNRASRIRRPREDTYAP